MIEVIERMQRLIGVRNSDVNLFLKTRAKTSRSRPSRWHPTNIARPHSTIGRGECTILATGPQDFCL